MRKGQHRTIFTADGRTDSRHVLNEALAHSASLRTGLQKYTSGRACRSVLLGQPRRFVGAPGAPGPLGPSPASVTSFR